MIWRWIHYFSLDVACGAIGGSMLLARACRQSIPGSVVLALVIAVLLIYHIDHYYDAIRIHQTLHSASISERRTFHWNYRHILMTSIIILCMSALVIIFYLPSTLLLLGIMSACLSALYLVFVHRNIKILKEPIIAIIYATALTLWPVSMAIDYNLTLPLIFYLEWVLLLGIALLNLLMLSSFEYVEDQLEDSHSWLTYYNQEQTRKICFYLIGMLLLLHSISFSILYMDEACEMWLYYDQYVLLAMSCTLIFILVKPDFSKKNQRYRLWGELIFCYPIVIECLKYLFIPI